MVYDVGAVVQFYPTTPRQVTITGPGALTGKQMMRVGYAIVVIARSGWTVQTTIRTVVEDGSGMLVIVVGNVSETKSE